MSKRFLELHEIHQMKVMFQISTDEGWHNPHILGPMISINRHPAFRADKKGEPMMKTLANLRFSVGRGSAAAKSDVNNTIHYQKLHFLRGFALSI